MKIITLTLNPAFDVHCHVENFSLYHEHLAKITDRDASGKGINISRALKACDTESLALMVLGDENGESFARAIAADGLRSKSVTVPGRIRENITVHTNGAPETRISFAGFAADKTLLDQVNALLEGELDSETLVTFTGRNPEGLDMADVKYFIRGLEARGARVVIDSRSFTLEDILDVRPWMIKPNQEEISAYLGRPIESFDEVAAAAEELYGKGIANVMISLGEQGAMIVCDNGRFVATPPRIDAISTIGAGDSSIAGFLAATAEGEEPEEALRRAVCYGSGACLTEGTRPPRAEDVESLMHRVTLKKI
ncbi:MAG: hexose kinase [Clostridia bacterium]|nr:hexose kinase [Clostridia bacterium]